MTGGFLGTETTVRELVEAGILARPMDGNHGEIHPKTADFVDSGIPFIMASDLGCGVVDLSGCAFISVEQASRLRKGFARTGDVLLSHKGTVGRTALVGDLEAKGLPFLMLTPQVTYYRVSDRRHLDPKFLRFYFQSPYFQAVFNAWSQKGATRAYLGITAQLDLPVYLPDIDHQERVGDILSAYDDLIENNNRRMALLEEAIHLLYREWFVYLRFPGHDRVEVVDGVPEGWCRGVASDCLSVLSGGTPKTKVDGYWGGEIPFFTPKDAPAGPFVWSTEKTLTEEGLRNCNSRLFPRDTLFITARGTVGKLALAQQPMAMNQSCYALEPRAPYDAIFLYCAMREVVRHLKQAATGGVFDTIIVKTFDRTPMLSVPGTLAQQFSDTVRPLVQQADALTSMNRQLQAARDLLLPRLMNGSIAV